MINGNTNADKVYDDDDKEDSNCSSVHCYNNGKKNIIQHICCIIPLKITMIKSLIKTKMAMITSIFVIYSIEDKADNDKADNDKADYDKVDNDKADNDTPNNDKADNDKADYDKLIMLKLIMTKLITIKLIMIMFRLRVISCG
jgi:hypothetical protein